MKPTEGFFVRAFVVALAIGLTSCETTMGLLDEMVTVNGKPLSTALANAGVGNGTSSSLSKNGNGSTKSYAERGWVKSKKGAFVYFPHPGRDDSSQRAPRGVFEWSGSKDSDGHAHGKGTFTWHASDNIYQYQGALKNGVFEGNYLARTVGRDSVRVQKFANSRKRGTEQAPPGSLSAFASPGSGTATNGPKPVELTPEQKAERLAILRDLKTWRAQLSPGDQVKFYQYGLPTTNPVLAIKGSTVYYHWKSFMGESRRSIDLSYVFPPDWALVGKIRTATNGFKVVNHAVGQTYSVRVDTNNRALFTELETMKKFDEKMEGQEKSSLQKAADAGDSVDKVLQTLQE